MVGFGRKDLRGTPILSGQPCNVERRERSLVRRQLGASHIYELVSASNIPSRRMVEASGLRLEPTLTCGIATPHESVRFTKCHWMEKRREADFTASNALVSFQADPT
jgi:hypothetical protein